MLTYQYDYDAVAIKLGIKPTFLVPNEMCLWHQQSKTGTECPVKFTILFFDQTHNIDSHPNIDVMFTYRPAKQQLIEINVILPEQTAQING